MNGKTLVTSRDTCRSRASKLEIFTQGMKSVSSYIYMVIMKQSDCGVTSAGYWKPSGRKRQLCKIGKTDDLTTTRAHYTSRFGENNISFVPMVALAEIESAEQAVLNKLEKYRMNEGPDKSPNWIEGIEPIHIMIAAYETLDNLGVDYRHHHEAEH